jgi:hypothetical protein
MTKEGDLPSNKHVTMVYSGTSGPCGARRMLVDLYMQRGSGQEMVGHSFLEMFMVELATSMAVHWANPTGVPYSAGRTADAYHDQ